MLQFTWSITENTSTDLKNGEQVPFVGDPEYLQFASLTDANEMGNTDISLCQSPLVMFLTTSFRADNTSITSSEKPKFHRETTGVINQHFCPIHRWKFQF